MQWYPLAVFDNSLENTLCDKILRITEKKRFCLYVHVVYLLIGNLFLGNVFLSINGSLLSITRWMNDLFKKGYKQNLENSDIYQILPEEESEHLADRLER